MKIFLQKLFIYSLLIAAIDLGWICLAPIANHVPHVWMVLAFFITLTSLFHFMSQSAFKDRPQVLVRFYMMKTVLRLFICVAAILAYRFYDKNSLVPFAIGFMVHYFFFSAFEMLVIRKELKKS